jgi:hypothetical protein
VYVLSAMTSRGRFGWLGILLVVGCHAGEEHARGVRCDQQRPCRSPLICVDGLCETPDGSATSDDANDAGDASDDTTHAGDGATDVGDTAPDLADTSDADGGEAGGGAVNGGDVRDDASDAVPDGDASDGEKRPPPPPSGTCAQVVASACPVPAGHPGCAEIFCGQRLWERSVGSYDGLITFRIDDPQDLFSESYESAIRSIAQAWSSATEGLVAIRECPTCFGRIVVVVPGTGDGIVDPTQYAQVLPMPVKPGAPLPLHAIAHQWGHVMGIGHTYERADRDRYVRFDPTVWCGADRSGLPPRCAFGPDQPGLPAVASDTFGVYDEKSKMNGFSIDGICGSAEPDPASGVPTDSDGSAVEELYMERTGGWSPFQPIARSTSPTQPLDYQLAPGVDPVGSPAITEWTPPALEVFARGTDGAVYTTHNQLSGFTFQQWSPWEVVATDVDADPAAMHADPKKLHLVVRARADGSIRLRTRANGVWGAWSSLGAPAAGAASAPTIAVKGAQPLSVLVRGGDGLIYLFTCTDATTCAANAGRPDAWSPLPAPPPGTLIGKPTAVFIASGNLKVAAVASDRTAWLIDGAGVDFSNRGWGILPGIEVMPGDPDPAVAVQAYGDAIGLYARGPRGTLIDASPWYFISALGGVIKSAPAVTAALDGQPWVHFAALVDDHGHPGVWLKYYGGFKAPCNYNAPGTCAQCGCNVPNGPACEM